MYHLVLTFFVIIGNGSGIGATTIPTPFPSLEACEIAARQAKTDYADNGGGAKVDFVCVPVDTVRR